MIVKYVIPLLALAGVSLAVLTVIDAAQSPKIPPPPIEPARAPFDSYIAASGIVEASTENIAIATIVPGVVVTVDAKVGTEVKRGDLLFQIDDRDLGAAVQVERASVASAEAKLARLHALPRIEDLRTAEAKLVEADADLTEAKDQLALAASITDARAISREELTRRRSAVDVETARRSAAAAQLDWQKSGAWQPDVVIAESELASAKARLESALTNVERCSVRAPLDSTVLQVNLRPGEYASTGVLARPLVLLGATTVLNVRSDIDENDAWRFAPNARAKAFMRGNRELSADLALARVEPYVVPKRSLTGDSTERVDTRVLQVLYSFDPKLLHAYVGQQVDVFIEAPSIIARPTAPATTH